jgi:hypothetical protein
MGQYSFGEFGDPQVQKALGISQDALSGAIKTKLATDCFGQK